MKPFHQKEWLKRAYLEHKTLAAVARIAGCSLQHIARQMKKFGLPYKHNTAKNYRTQNAAGYTLVFVGKGKPGTTKWGYAYEHRVIMEKHLKRQLRNSEAVHHINGNKSDNRILNLRLTTRSAHQKHHIGLRVFSREKAKKAYALILEYGISQHDAARIVDVSTATLTRYSKNIRNILCPFCARKFETYKGFNIHVRHTHEKEVINVNALMIFGIER